MARCCAPGRRPVAGARPFGHPGFAGRRGRVYRGAMTAETSNTPTGGPPAPGDRAQTMALQGVANRLVRGLLRTPLISRGVGKRMITLYVVGRKSGRRFNIPVVYTDDQGVLLVATPFGWGRNLRTGEPLQVRFKGRLRTADVEVIKDEPGVTEYYQVIVRDNANFAKFNKIGFDSAGNPNLEDIHLSWAAGARVFRLTLR